MQDFDILKEFKLTLTLQYIELRRRRWTQYMGGRGPCMSCRHYPTGGARVTRKWQKWLGGGEGLPGAGASCKEMAGIKGEKGQTRASVSYQRMTEMGEGKVMP